MLYPLKFKPRFKERIWGGEALMTILGKKLPDGKRIGESWELSGLQGDISVVSNGNLKSNNLQEMVEIFMGDLVGDKVYQKFGMEFPLLVKFLDAEDLLSIQVHPGDKLAAERHGSYGKAEMWYIIAAEPDAYLYLGFKKPTTESEYFEALSKGTLSELLNRMEVKQGDIFFVPPGTIHSIGKGLLVAEIQQTSDINYRIYDWDRTDTEGNSRELHSNLAIEAIDFSMPHELKITAEPKLNEAVKLVRCPYFTTNLVKIKGEVERSYSGLDSFVIYICLEGKLAVGFGAGYESLSKGETMLVPAQEEFTTLRGEGTLLEVYIE